VNASAGSLDVFFPAAVLAIVLAESE